MGITRDSWTTASPQDAPPGGRDRVEMDVPRHRPERGLVLHHLGPIASLEDMAAEAVSSRRGVGVSREEPLHAWRDSAEAF